MISTKLKAFFVLTLTVSMLVLVHVANAAEQRVIAEYGHAYDTERYVADQLLVGYDRFFSEEDTWLGFRVGQRKYTEDLVNDSVSFDVIKGVGHHNITKRWEVFGDITFLDSNVWSPSLYNFGTVYLPTEKTRAELFVTKEIMDSVLAIREGITYVVYGGTFDYRVNKNWLLVGILNNQNNSDGNQRSTIGGNVFYYPDWFENGWLSVKMKTSKADFDPVEYFSPEDYDRYIVGAGYTVGIDPLNGFARFEGGIGQQAINGISETAWEYKALIKGWVTPKVGFGAEYWCTSDEGEYDYSYCFLGATAEYKW